MTVSQLSNPNYHMFICPLRKARRSCKALLPFEQRFLSCMASRFSCLSVAQSVCFLYAFVLIRSAQREIIIQEKSKTYFPFLKIKSTYLHVKLRLELAKKSRILNLWITRSVSNKLLWALGYANLSLRCRHLS